MTRLARSFGAAREAGCSASIIAASAASASTSTTPCTARSETARQRRACSISCCWDARYTPSGVNWVKIPLQFVWGNQTFSMRCAVHAIK